ncbi:MAG TPA: hypothetical protein VHX14_04490 [Thermoanaerobaculia bacterium]|jgi:hypothetical protein|nr:hypothetical protein [Thermoanaerobaculia bacterium]
MRGETAAPRDRRGRMDDRKSSNGSKAATGVRNVRNCAAGNNNKPNVLRR